MIYNSALNNGTSRVSAPPVERFTANGCVGMRWNIVTEPVPPEIYTADVVYCEPPFPAGLKVFDARAGANTPSFMAFAKSFSEAWGTLSVPRYAVTSAQLRKALPAPAGSISIRLNGGKEQVSFWDAPCPPNGISNMELYVWLGLHFKRVADITCGYGTSVLTFMSARPGNTFVASDYDPSCVGVVRERLLSLSPG